MQNRRFVLPLQSQKGNGSLDEWLSQRSAKPCTAVRIRQEPLEILATYTENQLGGKDFSFILIFLFSDSTQEAVNVTQTEVEIYRVVQADCNYPRSFETTL